MTEHRDRKVGLLGAGYILEAHAKAVQGAEGAVLHAVCDVAVGRAKAAAARFGIPHVYDSIEALAASDCDAVHVLLPPHLHAPAARTLIEAGKAVFLEKPMAPSATACAEVTALAETRGVRLGVNHNFLFQPAYEEIRAAKADGRIGAIDHLTVNWLYALPVLQFGPFDAWMVREPGNLLFELGSHIASFAIDLVGPPGDLKVVAGSPVDLPGGKRVWRHVTVTGTAERASLVLNLSVTPGQADRSLRLRGAGAVAQLDFERNIGWLEQASHANPIFDNYRTGKAVGSAIGRRARRDIARFVKATLTKAPAANPFEESIGRSVAAFYRDWHAPVDPRLAGTFGTQVIALCEAAAKQLPASEAAAAVAAPMPAAAAPTALVVGGTGFIGRRLVEQLVAKGHGVRVLTRGVAGAEALLGHTGAEIMQGSHGNPDDLVRALAGIETVYHLAKADGGSWDEYLRNDVEPTRRLAEAALAAGVKRFIYTGTIDSYASAKASDVITGDTPLDPAIATRNLYARSKAACEALLNDMHRTQGLPLVVFRPGIVIGGGSPPAHWGVGRFNSATDVEYWGEGTHPLPFVLVDDVADALVRALDAPEIEGETFLLTDAPLLSAEGYAAAVAARSGSAINARPTPIWRFFAEDVVKEGLKNAIRHPKRRRPSYHDWDCRSHRARYDSGKTIARLGWQPAGTRERLIAEGVNASVDRFMK